VSTLDAVMTLVCFALATMPAWPVWAELWQRRKRRLKMKAIAQEFYRKEWLREIQALGMQESDFSPKERP
jgi:hypothetical protein